MKSLNIVFEQNKVTPVYFQIDQSQPACNAFLEISVNDEVITLTADYTLNTNSSPYDIAMMKVLRVSIPAEISGKMLKELEIDEGFIVLVNRLVDGHTVEWDGNNHRGQLSDDAIEADQELSVFFSSSDCIEVITDVQEWVSVSFTIEELASKGLHDLSKLLTDSLEPNQGFGSNINEAIMTVAAYTVEEVLEEEELSLSLLIVINMLIEHDDGHSHFLSTFNALANIIDFFEVTIGQIELIDDCVYQDEDGKYQPSEISVEVGFECAGEDYSISFQTTSTHDAGAYSSILAAYDGNGDYELLYKELGEENASLVLNSVLKESNAQYIRNQYVDDNYIVSKDNFGGMDANSEVNKAVKKKS
ncbi:MAG: hypothetical protein RPS47_12715 [Colwellia sp.]